MPVLSAALRARPHLEAPTRHLRWPDGQPVPALAGRNRTHWRFSNMLRGPPQISGDIFGEAFDHDAPAYAELWVPVVHFEGEPSLCDKVQLGARSGAEHHDTALHRVIDRKNLRLALHVKRDPTQVARSKQKFALIRRQRLDRLIWCYASVHPLQDDPRCNPIQMQTTCPNRDLWQLSRCRDGARRLDWNRGALAGVNQLDRGYSRRAVAQAINTFNVEIVNVPHDSGFVLGSSGTKTHITSYFGLRSIRGS